MNSHVSLREQSLPPRALGYLMTRSACELAVGTVVIAMLLAQFAEGRWATVAWSLLLVGTALTALVEIPYFDKLKVRFTTFSANSERVVVRRGRWLRKVTTIPSRQILSVEVVEGPLLRRFALVNVRFTCISEIERLGPLEPAVARDLVEIVAKLRDPE